MNPLDTHDFLDSLNHKKISNKVSRPQLVYSFYKLVEYYIYNPDLIEWLITPQEMYKDAKETEPNNPILKQFFKSPLIRQNLLVGHDKQNWAYFYYDMIQDTKKHLQKTEETLLEVLTKILEELIGENLEEKIVKNQIHQEMERFLNSFTDTEHNKTVRQIQVFRKYTTN